MNEAMQHSGVTNEEDKLHLLVYCPCTCLTGHSSRIGSQIHIRTPLLHLLQSRSLLKLKLHV